MFIRGNIAEIVGVPDPSEAQAALERQWRHERLPAVAQGDVGQLPLTIAVQRLQRLVEITQPAR